MDHLDADTGPNDLQNQPLISSFSSSGGSTTITGWLNSVPNSTVLLLFYDAVACDASGHGEGGAFIGSLVLSVDGNGIQPWPGFTATFPYSLPPGHIVTATAASGGAYDRTSEFSACGANKDYDQDTFRDPNASAHEGPSNTNTAVDNCPPIPNFDQLNSDGNFIDLTPPKASDDLTWPNSDEIGDVCDDDDDNDGRTDVEELTTPCAGGFSDPLLRDTDNDRFLDGAECMLGTNPADPNSKPTLAACGPATDEDGDGILTRVEFCFYATDPFSANTDGDSCGDRREIMSVNADQAVTAADLGLVAGEFGAYAVGSHRVHFDVNKDGAVSSADLGQVALAFGSCP
jgi:hypothetical protein